MEAFLVSALVVAIGEIGDKTQLLALILAARFRRPVPIIVGILCATLLNHALAGLLGGWIREAISPEALRWGLGLSFLAIAAWALKPDEMDDKPVAMGRYGAFAVTFVAFFIAEIGDKTQLATVALAARFDSLVAVVAGTTVACCWPMFRRCSSPTGLQAAFPSRQSAISPRRYSRPWASPP